MIANDQKTSLLVSSQLPEFVRDNPDYANFNLFLTAYYEWMEQNGKVTERTKNLLNYKDIDETTDEFLDYFTNDFLPYFPKDILIDKQKAVKVARELYQTKGTPASYEFLFRVLYNSDFDIFYTKDAVLKASAGTWYVAKSLKLASTDLNFLNTANYRLFGETTKTLATVENAVVSGTKIEVFISNIERLFESGEFVRVVDNANQDVLFDGQPLRAKIVGQISQLRIDPKNRGLFYQVGDPVVVYGGLNSNTGIGATAEISETTKGSITGISVLTGGYGYTSSPNTQIVITPTYGATATVASFDPDYRKRANVSLVPIDTISLKKDITIGNTNYHFSNITTSNANTTLANALTFTSFTTYPISSVIVTNGGSGISTPPSVTAESDYITDISTYAPLSSLGILAPIQITNGGLGYQANDRIVFTGGGGIGAAANVITVAANGAITNIAYVSTSTKYPLGGMGYSVNYLPAVTVNSANTSAAGAVLYVPGILGDGATFSANTDRAGSITTISVTNPGEDYITTPNVSLKVQDIVVSNVSIFNLPSRGETLYQGANTNVSTYLATVESTEVLEVNGDPTLSLFRLRVFNYNSNPDPTKTLNIDKNIHMNMANTQYDATYNQYGYKNYGDGTAKGTASFLNGLVVSQGQYLTTQGQPSSFDVLQSTIYNNFTYQITVEKEIAKYRSVLLELLHPTGMNVIGRNALKSNASYNFHGTEALNQGHTLEYYTNYPASGVTMTADFTNKSNNIVSFNNLAGSNIANYIFTTNSSIVIIPTHGGNVHAEIVKVDTTSNTVTISSNVWLTYANVAIVTGNSGANVINITSLTGAYDIVNNGNYSNTAYPLKDIVYAGDKVLVDNNTSKTVSTVDYVNGKIYLTANLTANANSYLAVNRTFSATSNNVIIYGPIGLQYNPQLITEDGRLITTEDGQFILLG
jgi:hypothetical protein